VKNDLTLSGISDQRDKRKKDRILFYRIMKTYAICPISDKKVIGQVARLNGLFTVLLLILFGFTGQWFIPALFISGSGIRILRGLRNIPVCLSVFI